MFIAIIGKTDIDLLALEKGELDEGAAGKWLNTTFDFFNQKMPQFIDNCLIEIGKYSLKIIFTNRNWNNI